MFGGALRPGVSLGPQDWRKSDPTRAPAGDYVYAITGAGLVKIGISGDPCARLRNLQTGCGHPLSLVFTAPASGNAFTIEQEAHSILGAHRAEGEWFRVTPDMAVAAIYAAADRTGCSLTLSQKSDEPGWVIWPTSSIGQIFAVFMLLFTLGSLMRLFK